MNIMIKKMRPVSHPGEYIKDAIDELGISQSEFAYRTGLSIKNISTLINGESNITFEVATKLSAFFGNSVEGWMNLQIKYDLYLNEAKKEEAYQKDWKIAQLFDKEFFDVYFELPISAKHKEETIDELRSLLRVSSLQNLKEPDMFAFCKTSVMKDLDEKTIILRNAWISIAENTARSLSCSSFNKELILNNQKYLRFLTLKSPREFYYELSKFLSDAGIKLVILPYLRGSNVSGVTKWISSENCVLVAVNDCGKDADRIWFTIFHELGHAIKNHKRHMTISYSKNNIEDEEENAANEFAKNLLINKSDYLAFISRGKFDKASIQKFAKEQGVADFIVLGRLQKEKYVPWDKYQDMKRKYEVLY